MYNKRLEELRLKKQITKREAAKAFNVSESTYGKWELGQRKPDLEAIAKLAEYFEVSTDYLLGATDDPTPPAKEKDPLEGLKFALWGHCDVTDEMLNKVREFALFIEEKSAEKEHQQKDVKTK